MLAPEGSGDGSYSERCYPFGAVPAGRPQLRKRGSMKRLYLVLAALGWIVPYYFFLSFLLENGLDLPLLMDQLFANDISTFFAVDLVITALVSLAFSYRESQSLGMKHWWGYLVATLAVGPSFALPFFLYNRQGRLETRAVGRQRI